MEKKIEGYKELNNCENNITKKNREKKSKTIKKLWDLFDETITIISTGDRPDPKATIVQAITNIKETDSFVSFDQVQIGKEKFNRWQLDKKGLTATYQWWYGLEVEFEKPRWIQGSEFKCEKKLPDRLKPYT